MPALARIDWEAAFEHYLKLGYARRYAEVAAAFGVSLTAVKEHARRHRWRRRVAAIEKKARTRSDRELAAAYAKRVEATLGSLTEAWLRLTERLRVGCAFPRLVERSAKLITRSIGRIK